MKVFHPLLNDATEPNPVETVAFRRNRWVGPGLTSIAILGGACKRRCDQPSRFGLLQKENLLGTTSLSINALASGMERTIRASYVGFLY
jgi:hypothetical protein